MSVYLESKLKNLENSQVSQAVDYIRGLVKQLSDAGMPPEVVDKMATSMGIIEEAASKSMVLPSVSMSSVALKKTQEMVADGFTVCGFTLEKEGQSSAVMFDSAVRWLLPDERRLLMFTEGSKVTKPDAGDVEPMPDGGMSDDALEGMVRRLEASTVGAGKEIQAIDMMRLARGVRALVYKAGPVAGLKRARLLVSRVHGVLQEAESQGFGKVTVALLRNTMEPYLPLSDREFTVAVEPDLLNAAQAVVDAERGDYLSSSLITQLEVRCDEAHRFRVRAVQALSADDVKALLEGAMASQEVAWQELLISIAEKISLATGDEYAGRLVESVRKAINFQAASAPAGDRQPEDQLQAAS